MSATLRVLLVEDQPLNLELATDVLEAAGFTVLQATTAETGVQTARRERPDIILMDLRLPGMDGHHALRLLRADPETRAIPTIALTAQAMKGDQEAALAAGFDGYLAKPIDTRSFARLVAGFARPDAQ
jgi:two-component system cell cycle response regulator DivK